MKRTILASLAVLTLLFCGCSRKNPPVPPTQTQPQAVTTEDTLPAPQPTEPPVTQPEHSQFYIPGVPVEDVILYFNEVCLDSEFINSGDPSLVQKWTVPISYVLQGDYTEMDEAIVITFEEWLKRVDGFPGISPAESPDAWNLRICFCTAGELVAIMGPDFENMDGAVTFWYDNDEIYDGVICCRTDLSQHLRNSVLLEELYNSLGPIQDTTLRPDSIIYQEYSENQWLSPMDELILKLLYHPDILPGMNAAECEQVIRSLYY